MTKQNKQRIREWALSQTQPFNTTTVKMHLTDLFGTKAKEIHPVLEEMVAEGALVLHAAGEDTPLGGEGLGKQRLYSTVAQDLKPGTRNRAPQPTPTTSALKEVKLLACLMDNPDKKYEVRGKAGKFLGVRDGGYVFSVAGKRGEKEKALTIRETYAVRFWSPGPMPGFPSGRMATLGELANDLMHL